MSSRAQNEEKFGRWDELADGGRRYWLNVPRATDTYLEFAGGRAEQLPAPKCIADALSAGSGADGCAQSRKRGSR